MKYPIVVKLPRLFYIDHRERDLPSGEIIRYVGRHQVEVSLDQEGFEDLISDAYHYGFGGMDWDGFGSEGSLERSARRVHKILTSLWKRGE